MKATSSALSALFVASLLTLTACAEAEEGSEEGALDEVDTTEQELLTLNNCKTVPVVAADTASMFENSRPFPSLCKWSSRTPSTTYESCPNSRIVQFSSMEPAGAVISVKYKAGSLNALQCASARVKANIYTKSGLFFFLAESIDEFVGTWNGTSCDISSARVILDSVSSPTEVRVVAQAGTLILGAKEIEISASRRNFCSAE